MLKKYNVTVQRSLIYSVNQKQILCNSSDDNRMFKRIKPFKIQNIALNNVNQMF